MTTKDFIRKSLLSTTKKDMCSSVLRYGDTLYSYGRHYPLVRIINGKAYVNTAGYSNTTAKHINWAMQAAHEVVGSDNTYGIPLCNDDELSVIGIKHSALVEQVRVAGVMTSKKRKDTQVYADLKRQYDNTIEVLNSLEVA